MKLRALALTATAIAFGSLIGPVSLAFAQNTPGTPDGILGSSFQINQHPYMPFAASTPSAKYQHGTSAERKRGDNGDPDGCNLQCPSDNH